MRERTGSDSNNRFFAGAAIALVCFIFLVNLYRAWTQSITADEAFSYNLFLDGPVSKLFRNYDAAHHVFHTILCKISVSIFGLSEFTLRIPSLLGGLLYLVVVFRISRRLFGRGPLLLISVALLSLNPFVLDHLTIARGYGLAVALFLWALYDLHGYVSEKQAGDSLVYRGAIGLALAVSANLTLLLPATGLAVLFLAVLWIDARRSPDRPARRRQFRLGIDSFLVPGITTAFLLLILPLTKARMENFYVGTRSLGEASHSILAPSLYHHALLWKWPAYLEFVVSLQWIIGRVLVPAVLILTLLACALAAFQWARKGSFRDLSGIDQFLFFAGGAMLIALGLMVAGHYVFGILYPFARTGLYLIPLFVLTCMALWAKTREHRLVRLILRMPAPALAVLCVAQFVLQFQTAHYGQWRYDAGTKRIVNLIRERHREQRQQKISAGISWELEPSMNFYRRMYRLGWLEPLTRDGPEGTYDYYVLLKEQAPLVRKLRLSVLYRDPVSGEILAVRGGGNPQP